MHRRRADPSWRLKFVLAVTAQVAVAEAVALYEMMLARRGIARCGGRDVGEDADRFSARAPRKFQERGQQHKRATETIQAR